MQLQLGVDYNSVQTTFVDDQAGMFMKIGSKVFGSEAIDQKTIEVTFEILEEKDKLIQKQFERIDLLKHRIKLMGISFSKQRKLDKECLSAKLDAKLDRIDIKLKNSTLRVKLVSHTYGYPILLHIIEVIDQH
ncbi:MAG: hypothetical protein VX777_04900 [Chlamydiota bacterium]|nr:hypothetical protein [Chlamydiota bacterium]